MKNYHGIIERLRLICLRNVQDLLADGKTQNERRFGESFNGPIIPFGAPVEYLPNSERDKAGIHQFGKKVLPGIFQGYYLIAVGIWKGDILVADIEELEKLDASEIYPRRLNAKEVLITHRRRICISWGRWFSNIIRKRLRIPRTHSEPGIHRKERESQWRICEEVGVVKGVHLHSGEIRSVTTALKVVEEVQEEMQEIKDE